MEVSMTAHRIQMPISHPHFEFVEKGRVGREKSGNLNLKEGWLKSRGLAQSTQKKFIPSQSFLTEAEFYRSLNFWISFSFLLLISV